MRRLLGPGGVMCLTGISTRTDAIGVPMAQLNRQLVMGNAVIAGSVNAAKRHYATAVDALAAADRSWLERLVSRTIPLSDWPIALNKTPDDIKVAVDLQD